MKFYSDIPDLHIIRQRLVGNRQEAYELCVFDKNGELESNDAEVIRQLQNIYRHDETVSKDVSPKAKGTLIKCKKCSFETDNKGKLAAHFKKEHPKGR